MTLVGALEIGAIAPFQNSSASERRTLFASTAAGSPVSPRRQRAAAIPALAAASARGARDYLEVYGQLLRQADRPVILHWLGEAFDPALRGYWGSTEFGAAAQVVLELVERADGKVDGIKLSVLDASKEVALRRRLPSGIRLYTGDDFGYADLIRGDGDGTYPGL